MIHNQDLPVTYSESSHPTYQKQSLKFTTTDMRDSAGVVTIHTRLTSNSLSYTGALKLNTSGRILTSFTKLVFDDSDCYVFGLKEFATCNKHDKIFVVNQHILKLRIRHDGKMSIVRGNSLVTNCIELYKDLDLIKMYIKVLHNTLSIYKEIYPDLALSNLRINQYYLSRNNKLLQLPVSKDWLCETYYDTLTLNDRRKVNYHLGKGNTHKATAVIVNKNLPKTLRSASYKNSNLAVALYIENVHIENFLKHRPADHIQILVDKGKLRAIKVLAYVHNLSLQKVLNTDIHDSMFSDIIRFVKYFLEKGIPVPQMLKGEPIRAYHDRVYVIHNEEMDKLTKEKNKLYALPIPRKYLEITDNSYKVAEPITILELTEIGNKLNICVGSYKDRVYNKEIDIGIVVDKNNNYIACLEIKEGKLVQAKLKYNRKVVTNKGVYDIVIKWCVENNIHINTTDMIENFKGNLPIPF